MKATLTHPSWANIEKGCAKIAHQILKSGYQPDFIVGLTRGGLIPSVILSHMLDIPVIPANYSSTKGDGDDKNHTNKLPKIFGEKLSGVGRLPLPPNLLVVDDICDSGHTLYEVHEHYAKEGHTIRTAALYYKYFVDYRQIIKPDFYWQEIRDGDSWIEFPWEV